MLRQTIVLLLAITSLSDIRHAIAADDQSTPIPDNRDKAVLALSQQLVGAMRGQNECMAIPLIAKGADPLVKTVFGDAYSIALEKHNTNLIDLIDAAIRLKKAQGKELSELLEKWGNSGYWLARLARTYATEHGIALPLPSKDTLDKQLFRAVEDGNESSAASLLAQGANPNARDNEGQTPLHIATLCNKDDSTLVKLLLDKGAVVDAQDAKGRTPLYYAIHYWNKKIAQLLLEAGARVDVTDKAGVTPLELVLKQSHELGPLKQSYGLASLVTPYAQKQAVALPIPIIDQIASKEKKTQTVAYLSVPSLKQLVQTKLGVKVIGYKNILLKVIDQEQKLSDYDVAYHAQKIDFQFVYDVLKELFSWLDNQANIREFEYLRIPGAAFAFKQAIADIIKKDFGDIAELSQEDRRALDFNPAISKILLAANLSLFGNTGKNFKESTFYFYFLDNRSVRDINVIELLQDIFERIGMSYNDLKQLDDFYKTEFTKLLAQKIDRSGNLIQIFIPKNKVNDYLYLSGVHGVPLQTITINGQSTNVHELGAEKFIEIYRNNPAALDPEEMDQIQARLFLTNTFLLNPASGIKIYTYNTLDPNLIAEYKRKLHNLVGQLMIDWATTKGIMSKQLAITNQQEFQQKANLLVNSAQKLLQQWVTPEDKQKAQEVFDRLSALIEVYGQKYGTAELITRATDSLHDVASKFALHMPTFTPQARISTRLYALALKNASPTDVQKHNHLKALYNQLPTATAIQRKAKEIAREKFKSKFNDDPEEA